ncbi:unnamed protein product [Citrullus colocynthis]|uniref:Uncharacterized protein n=1 Tax=Citrullus colocynthis TaxID=252529 RepID=A0ABP0Z9W0_9ROSI
MSKHQAHITSAVIAYLVNKLLKQLPATASSIALPLRSSLSLLTLHTPAPSSLQQPPNRRWSSISDNEITLFNWIGIYPLQIPVAKFS